MLSNVPTAALREQTRNTQKESVTKDPKKAVDSLQGRKQNVYKDLEQ